MRIHLFANKSFGAPLVDAALATCRQLDVQLVIVRSTKKISKPSWRARLGTFFGRRSEQRRFGVPVRTVQDVNACEFARTIEPGDIGIVAGFDQIFREPTIERFGQIVNIHPSILPRYRGPVPSHWCIEGGETWSGYTLHEVTPKIDDGPVLFQERVPISAGMSPAQLDRAIAERSAETLVAYLESAARRTEWKPLRLDASAIYRGGIDYQSFPTP